MRLFWLRWVFVPLRGLSLIGKQGATLLAQWPGVSLCSGFSCGGAWAPGMHASICSTQMGSEIMALQAELLWGMWIFPNQDQTPVPALAGGVLSLDQGAPFCIFETSSSTCNKTTQNYTQAHTETHKSLYIILKIWINPMDYAHVHLPILLLYYSDARCYHGEKLDGCTENFHAFCNSLWF